METSVFPSFEGIFIEIFEIQRLRGNSKKQRYILPKSAYQITQVLINCQYDHLFPSSFFPPSVTESHVLTEKNNIPYVVQLLSYVQLFAITWPTPLSSTISWCLLKFMSIELVTLSNLSIFCCPLLLLSSIFPSIRVSSNELALYISWPKYWSFSISPSN